MKTFFFPALLLIVATLVAGCSGCGSNAANSRADLRAAIKIPVAPPALSLANIMDTAAIRAAQAKATPEDKAFAENAYQYVLSTSGMYGSTSGYDTLIMATLRYPAPEAYLLLGLINKAQPSVEYDIAFTRKYPTDSWDDSHKAEREAGEKEFLAKHGPDGLAIEFLETAGKLGLSEGYYQAASLHAQAGDHFKANTDLDLAVDEGFADVPRFANDTTFDKVRALPSFVAVNQKLTAKYGELASYFSKFKERFAPLSVPLTLDSTIVTKKELEFEDQYEAFVPEVTTQSELQFLGEMSRGGPPTYYYVGSIIKPENAFDVLLFSAVSSDEGESRYLYIATYDKTGRRIGFYPVEYFSDYRDMDRSLSYATITIGTDFVINIASKSIAPENYDSENAPMIEKNTTQTLHISPDGKIIEDAKS